MAISRRPKKYGKRRARSAGARGGQQRAPSERGFILTVVDGVNTGKEYFFEQQAIVGRVEDSDVVLVEPGVSRRHARVYAEHGIYTLEDLGSANGTRLNGEKIEGPEVLRDGDYLTFSRTTFQFSSIESARGEATAQTRLSDIEISKVDAEQTSAGGPRRSRRRLWLLAAVALVAGGSLAAYKLLWQRDSAIVVFDQSDTPIPYSEEDSFFNAVFGLGKYDETHKRQAIIAFEYLGGRVTVQYGAWGIDKVGEVVIRANGKRVGKVPLTLDRWRYGLKLVLPRDKLVKGKTNRLVFDNTRNPPNEDPWQICYLQILQEAIPPPDPKEARHQFELAKKSYEDREVEPSNRAAALERFKRARDLLEGLAEKPALYQEALDQIDKVDKELTQRFQEGLFSARRAQRVDEDIRKARHVLIRTLRYFRKEDFRYRELSRYLDSLAEY